jgi:hypothetical protein
MRRPQGPARLGRRGLAADHRADLRHPPARQDVRYAGRQDWAKIAKDPRPVYTAPTEAAAAAWLEEFAETWGARYRSHREALAQLLGRANPVPGLRRGDQEGDLLHERGRVAHRDQVPLSIVFDDSADAGFGSASMCASFAGVRVVDRRSTAGVHARWPLASSATGRADEQAAARNGNHSKGVLLVRPCVLVDRLTVDRATHGLR